MTADRPKTPQIENEFFFAAFDEASGRFDIRRRGGSALLSGAVARAHTSRGCRATSQSGYRHSVETRRVRDGLGEGTLLIARSTDTEKELNFELQLLLYKGLHAVLLDVACVNVSSGPILLESLEPVRAVGEEGGALHWSEASKILTNGQMYSDPGTVADLNAGGEIPMSWWNIGLFRGYQREGLVCGHVDNQTSLGRVTARHAEGGALSLTGESLFARGFTVAPGGKARSNRFMMNIAPDPYAALESFAEIMGRTQSGRVNSIINGWCSWFYTYEHVTEEEVILNAEFAARSLKPFGLDVIQVDEGYQRWHGDWEGNDRFPHGMKWLADRIRGYGLKPGIWMAPYVISEPADVFRKHPDWMLRHPDGRLKRVGPWPGEDSDWAKNETPKRYCLDVTCPGASEWLAGLIDTVANRWGYSMIKIDFVGWSLLSADRYHDPAVSQAAAYRRGFEIMRASAGPSCHLQDCGPGPVSVGLLDSMRIELDQNYGFRREAWKQYFLGPACSASAAAKRYYFHKRTWINDADHVCLARLSVPQAQAVASLIALTGGNLISGDRLPELDPVRLDILKKAFPSSGEGARPVDLFDGGEPAVFAVNIRRAIGEWTVAGFFNAGETEFVERTLPLERLWLDPEKTYIAYDFWKEQASLSVRRELTVRVPPESVVLLALHEKRGIPQVISTDRHLLQGAFELESVRWDAGTQTLEGVSLGPIGTSHNVAVFIPEPHPWLQGKAFVPHDFPGYSLRMMDEHLLRVRVRFEREGRVIWKIGFNEIFG
jgi:hypothetical protein